MNTSIPVLVAIAGLLLLLGVLAILAIYLVASKCRCKSGMNKRNATQDTEQVDPWAEAGRRLSEEFQEQENKQKESP